MGSRIRAIVLMALVAIAIQAVLMMGPPAVPAADFKMGVLDPQEVLEKSKAGKRSIDALKEYARTRQKVLSSDEEELKVFEKQLKDSESPISETAKREKTELFKAKIQAYQKRAQEFNQDLSAKQKEMVDDYMKKIAAATKSVAEKGGFTIVVDKGSEQTLRIVIFHKDTIDLTDQVIKEFDRLNK